MEIWWRPVFNRLAVNPLQKYGVQMTTRDYNYAAISALSGDGTLNLVYLLCEALCTLKTLVVTVDECVADLLQNLKHRRHFLQELPSVYIYLICYRS